MNKNLTYRDIQVIINAMSEQELEATVTVEGEGDVYEVRYFYPPEDLGDIYPYRLFLDI